jgi:methanogenic corrinoid protein MtbC1
MYTIKWVADQLGLAPGTLRAWEQRYGIVRPTRSDVGYRLYDDADLDALRTMSRLVEAGMQPAQAAEQVRSGAVQIHSGAVQPRGEAEPVRPRDAPQGLPDPGALIAASRAYDVRALEDTLDAAFATAGFEHVIDGWLMAAMAEVGEAWAAGHLDVAQEHFISAGVMRRLAAAFDAAGHARGGRHVLTGLAPGATHQIATFAFATMLRRAGLRVTYLGPDLPVPSWVEAARATSPDAVVVGAPRIADTPAAAEVVRALREEAPHLPVYVGGPGAPAERRLRGTSLAAASDWLAETLAHT